MKSSELLAATALLTLLLSACGPPAEADPEYGLTTDDAAAPAAAAGAEVAAVPTVPGEATPTPGATPSETPTPGASAAPTAAASVAAAAPAAPMAPPAAFATCGVCHSVTPGQNMIGPSLAGVVGRRSGTAAGFSYSPAMRGANITWNDGTLDRYLADPAAVVAGGSMPAPGVDAAQRRAIIAYLKSL